MNRTQKQDLVVELREKFQTAEAVFVSTFQGLTVAQANELRRTLEKEGAAHRVVKNTLARRAVEGTSYEVLVDQFTGPTAVTFAGRDVVATAKAIAEFAKASNDALSVRSGALGGKLLSEADVTALSKLPGREQLLGQLVGVMVGPVRGLVGVLSGVPRTFVQVLHAIEEEKKAA